ncbi:MAG TPA: hypothetical protein DGH68_11130, partial [Bacteroidetes bacterium]|nr:hypothetical protein [Bacteroidota bacterium]
MKQNSIVVLFTLAATALIHGCGGEKFEYPDPSVQRADGAFVSKAATIKIGSAEYAADLGTITVSENRNRAASRLIHLPFIRIHSPSKNPREPIFVFNGGPGTSNMKWDWGIMWYLLREHDIVAVGYRGVDGS